MAQAQTLRDDDDDDLAGGGTANGAAPVDLPQVLRPSLNPIRPALADEPKPEPFQIVEVDNEGNEVGIIEPVAGAPAQPQAGGQQQTDQQDQDGVDQNGQPKFGKSWSSRQRKKEGRDRTLAELRATKAELAELRARVDTVGGEVQQFAPRMAELSEGQNASRIAQINGQIADLDRKFSDADDAFFDAMQSGDKEAYKKFGRARDEAAFTRSQLVAQRDEFTRTQQTRPAPDQRQAAPNQQQTQPAPQRRMSPQATTYSTEFLEGIPWLNQPGTEQDSKMLLTLDSQVANDGFDPSTPDYWDELADRCERYIPHRFQAVQAAPAQRQTRAAAPAAQQRRGPPQAAPGSASPRGAARQVRISPDRRAALEAANVIDSSGRIVDQKKFDRIASGFAEFDRANGVGR